MREDALFRRTLVMWMLMGFANLMVLPLRVEYLANPKQGVTWNGAVLTAAFQLLSRGTAIDGHLQALGGFFGVHAATGDFGARRRRG